ncbi:MAG TPA: iron chelate uptake ABC transporter family permease subunit [Planctomycetaceae bacterium]|nr:iron chelate uptake ABC transporter family permease subunit [Planctomycetaceae bacterium]
MALTYNTLIVLAGVSLLGACAGLVGSFAVLRRRALVGDALAHAALPGLCLAFLIVGERNLPAMLAGALATGVLGVAVISGLRHGTRVKEDAAIGIVLSVFYGAGIVLTSWIQNLATHGSKAGLTTYILGQTAGITRQDVWLIGGLSALCVLAIVLMAKEFKVVAFDPGFAGVQGWPAFRLDLLLMCLIALTVVIGLPMVGVVLIAALLIIPAAAARFWTDRLEVLLVLSAAFGLVIGAVGVIPSAYVPTLPGGPPIVLVGAGVFLASVLFAPRRGAIARSIANRRFRRTVAEQTALRVLYESIEPRLPDAPAVSIAEIQNRRAWDERDVSKLFGRLERSGLVAREGAASWSLTAAGLARAAAVTRAYRLWEVFLVEHAETAGNYADLDVESLEIRLPRDLIDSLEAKLKGA